MTTWPAPGDPLPWISLPTTREERLPLNGLAGRVVAVTLLDGAIAPGGLAAAIGDAGETLRAAFGFWLVITPPGIGAEALAAPNDPLIRLVPDPDGAVRQGLGLNAQQTETVSFVTDPGLRVREVLAHSGEPSDIPSGVLELVDRAAAARVDTDAPVILIPDVIEADLRDRLMTAWQDLGHQDTGYLRANDDGSLAHIVNPGRKRRADHFLDDESELAQQVHDRVRRRVAPWIERATHFKIGFAERYRIACYEAETSGFFSPHRDFSEASPHRHFAMTIALNDGYEGGALRFPEFGPREYRPAPGQAIVYAGTLMHEVTPVTGGRRFALVNFLTNGEGMRMVAEYQQRHGDTPEKHQAGG